MTYSIVARDGETGELGVAVQSHWFSVGSVVPWVVSGVGAVATQAFGEPSYGSLGLELLRGGKAPDQALRALLAVDEAPDRRQVSMLAPDGRAAVHTGELCIPEAEHTVGDGFTCQANMMLRTGVPEAMADAFTAATGELADRLLAALDAGEEAGGDVRGRQSAALVVVRGEATGDAYRDRLWDVRVEDHEEPLSELRRLVGVKRAYDRMNHADELLASGDVEAASGEYEAAQRAVPDNAEFTFWHAVMLIHQGRDDEAKELLSSVHDGWIELLRRLPSVGLLPDDAPGRVGL